MTTLKKSENRRVNQMEKTKRILVAMLALMLTIGFSEAISLAQQPAASEKSAPVKHDTMERIIVKGKIVNRAAFGGYYVQGEDPVGEFFIVNQNARVLKSHMTKGKAIKIEGRLTISADHLFIEKINGKKYSGDGKPAAK
jgi:hypothetical protein